VVGNEERSRKILHAVEGEAAAAMEHLVAGEGFARLLVQLTENVLALSRIGGDVRDVLLRTSGWRGGATSIVSPAS
jgi:hypothetical protein